MKQRDLGIALTTTGIVGLMIFRELSLVLIIFMGLARTFVKDEID